MEALASSHAVSHAVSHTASPRSLPTTVARCMSPSHVASFNGSVSRSLANQSHNRPRAAPPQRVSLSSFPRCPRRPSAFPRRHAVRSLKDAAASSPSAIPAPSLPSLPSLPSTHPAPPQVIPLKEIPAFVARSPLLQRVGLAQADVQRDAAAWGALGGELALQLGFLGGQGEGGPQLEEAQLRRIFQYYLPVFSWCWRQLQQHRRQAQGGKTAPTQAPPLVIGISAPQGCGKTTVVESLEHLFAVTHCTAAAVSIDDFYLTAQHQVHRTPSLLAFSFLKRQLCPTSSMLAPLTPTLLTRPCTLSSRSFSAPQAALREAHPGNRLLEVPLPPAPPLNPSAPLAFPGSPPALKPSRHLSFSVPARCPTTASTPPPLAPAALIPCLLLL
ncbi:unnamed protein product [Closterium sp. NIES-53]